MGFSFKKVFKKIEKKVIRPVAKAGKKVAPAVVGTLVPTSMVFPGITKKVFGIKSQKAEKAFKIGRKVQTVAAGVALTIVAPSVGTTAMGLGKKIAGNMGQTPDSTDPSIAQPPPGWPVDQYGQPLPSDQNGQPYYPYAGGAATVGACGASGGDISTFLAGLFLICILTLWGYVWQAYYKRYKVV